MSVWTDSGGQTRRGGDIGQLVFPAIVLDAAAQDQQASVLAGAEWERLARAGAPSESIWPVVVAGALAVKRSDRTRRLLLL